MSESPLPEGVRVLDHTADLGLEIVAPELPGLFVRAALGLEALIAGEPDASPQMETAVADTEASSPAGRPAEPPAPAAAGAAGSAEAALAAGVVALEAPDVALLLADWLRELLWLRQVRRRAFVRADFDHVWEHALRARILTTPAPPAIREIKGVTYHGLEATRTPAGWRARVIFDV